MGGLSFGVNDLADSQTLKKKKNQNFDEIILLCSTEKFQFSLTEKML